MAEAAPAKGGKKVLGLHGSTWALVGGGALALFFGYRFLHNRSASSSGAGATALSGGSSIPTAVTLPGTTTTKPTTFTAWITRALALVTTHTYNNAAAYSDITRWLDGQCVSAAGYNAISTILGSLGTPPNGAHPGTITVCGKTTGTGGTTTGGSSGSGGSSASGTGGTSTPAPTTTPSKNTTVSAILGKTINQAVLAGRTFYVLGSGSGVNYTGWNVLPGTRVFFTWKGNGTPTLGPPPATATTVTVYTTSTTPIQHISHHTKGGTKGL